MIDTDLDPTKRELIFEKIREERGQLGCVQIATFGTASAKSALQIAGRGLKINNDVVQYLSSLIPSERGFLWSLSDTVNGNKEKDRRPNAKFIAEIKQYDNLLEVAMSIEGLVVSRSIHASGVNFYDDDPFETACFMKAGNGSIITQFSLSGCEFCGDVKQDMLVTQQMTIMGQCIQMLQEHGYIEKELTLRQAYDKYVHPDKLPLEDNKLWDAIDSTDILALFQLNTAVGGNVVRQLVPRNVEELTACNALMRLTGEKGAERPADRYERLKKHPEQWQKEMDDWGFTKEQQQVLRKYMGADYGAPSSQEVLMLILMDPDTCNFTLAESNKARKIISKKKVDEIPKLKKKIIEQAQTPKLGEYIWEFVIMPQASYSFSRIHGYSYSLIACQAAYLATYFPSVYWNTAYLRAVGGLDEDEGTNYKKIAEGVCDIISHGVNVSLIDINKSEYFFEPDEENNRIIYGLKALNGCGGEVIQEIIKNRPYKSFSDFLERTNFNKTVVTMLIKSGAFDSFDERSEIMKQYIETVSDKKKRLTLSNFNGLIEADLIPQELIFQKRLFVFNKALKKNCKQDEYFNLDKPNYYKFYSNFFDVDELESIGDNSIGISQKKWKKMYDNKMLPAKIYLKDHQEEMLAAYNSKLFDEIWDKYACGNYSSWEMAALGMYYHEHELAHVDTKIYDIVPFNSLNSQPQVERYFKKGGNKIPIFKLNRIMGTVIAKDDAHSSISVLTVDSGVVTVKMNRDYFAMYNRRISEVQSDGSKKIIEQGWFQKGTLVVLNGIRRGDSFFLKSYKSAKNKSHQLYKITKVYPDGRIDMTNQRAGEEE
nr:MAG TPA: DNA polymerase III, alpha subunit [Caudoviricetes sp.]